MQPEYAEMQNSPVCLCVCLCGWVRGPGSGEAAAAPRAAARARTPQHVPQPPPHAPTALLAAQDAGLRKLQRRVEEVESKLRAHPLAASKSLQPRLEALLRKQALREAARTARKEVKAAQVRGAGVRCAGLLWRGWGTARPGRRSAGFRGRRHLSLCPTHARPLCSPLPPNGATLA